MLPHRRNETQKEGGDGLRVEFEVHVIGGARPAPATEDGGQLEIGLQIGSGQQKAKPQDSPVAPVHRLEVEDSSPAEPLRARRISEVVHEVGPAAPYVPRKERQERSLTFWTVWMAVGTCILAVAGVTSLMVTRKKQAQEPQPAIVFTPEQSFGEEKGYFLEHMAELTREAEDILGRYAAATTPEAVLPLVRDASRVKERLTALWQPMGSIQKDQPIEPSLYDGEERSALLLKGQKEDFASFQMVFVREDGQLKIDWEASQGIGDAQLSELRASKSVRKGVKVRVTIEPADFYTPEFPEAEYRSYQLIGAKRQDFVWAFVRKSSPAAERLDAIFNESSVLLEKVKSDTATLRISGPLHDNVNFFEITEMLHKGWISP